MVYNGLMKQQPTIEGLKSIMEYDSESGRLLWKMSRNIGRGKAKAGTPVGSVSPNGYLETSVNGYRTYAHRLAWAIHYGSWPSKHIDHIDGDKLNNAIANLRNCAQRINVENQRKVRSDNTSGFTGVMWRTDKKRWCAVIQANGKRMRRGGFDTPEEAHEAYLKAKRELHEGNTL
jgi:hypothetical protein